MGQGQTKQVLALEQSIAAHQHGALASASAPAIIPVASGPRQAPPPAPGPSRPVPGPAVTTTQADVDDITCALAAMKIDPTTPQKRKRTAADELVSSGPPNHHHHLRPSTLADKRRKLNFPRLPGPPARGAAPHRTSMPSFPRNLLPRMTAFVPSAFLGRTPPPGKTYPVEMEMDPPQPALVLYDCRWGGAGLWEIE